VYSLFIQTIDPFSGELISVPYVPHKLCELLTYKSVNFTLYFYVGLTIVVINNRLILNGLNPKATSGNFSSEFQFQDNDSQAVGAE
jgi:hypothetical protein